MLYVSVIKNRIIGNLPLIILILILGIFLGVKAVPETSWDNWQYGSAQTLLSDKHWVNDGFFKNYLLFLPQGYSKVVRYFDDLSLRQHAHGTVAGGLIGQRLYYNHYPAGYLIPTAILMKFGVENRFWFRFLEILFSLGSLIFLYWFLSKICNKTGAFLGVLFYAISVLFLGHADSLANQPIDSLLSFAIVALSAWLVESALENKKYLIYSIWILYFILAFSSYDSTFFIFAWLIGIDFIIEKKIRWRRLVFWASAPILAFGLQMLQSVLYLGWHDMLMDFYGIFNLKIVIVNSNQSFLLSHFQRLINPFNEFFFPKLGILIAAIGFAYVLLIRSQKYKRAYKYLILSGVATLFNFLFFPSVFLYQAKLVAVFGGLLIALIISENLEVLRGFKIPVKKSRFLYLIALVCIAVIFVAQIRTSYLYYNWKAKNYYSPEAIAFAKKVSSLASGDKVIFQVFSLIYEMPPSNPKPPYIRPTEETYSNFSIHDSHNNVPGNDPYPQANSLDEYYVGSPILGFARTSDLIRDLSYLKKRSEFPFSAIILSDQKDVLQKLRNDILFNKISKADIRIIGLESNKFAIVVPENDNVKQNFPKEDFSPAPDLENNQNSYVGAALTAPGVEGNIVNSGIYGKVMLAPNQPFEAALDVFKNGDMSKPFISVLSNPNGDFQIPLRPAYYIIKPANPYKSFVPELTNYYVHIGKPQWIQIKIEYK